MYRSCGAIVFPDPKRRAPVMDGHSTVHGCLQSAQTASRRSLHIAAYTDTPHRCNRASAAKQRVMARSGRPCWQVLVCGAWRTNRSFEPGTHTAGSVLVHSVGKATKKHGGRVGLSRKAEGPCPSVTLRPPATDWIGLIAGGDSCFAQPHHTVLQGFNSTWKSFVLHEALAVAVILCDKRTQEVNVHLESTLCAHVCTESRGSSQWWRRRRGQAHACAQE